MVVTLVRHVALFVPWVVVLAVAVADDDPVKRLVAKVVVVLRLVPVALEVP